MKKALSLSLLALACGTAAYAQAVAGYGAITGQIHDTAGDGIPDCLVVLTNKPIDVDRNMVTTDDGVFDAAALVPGSGYDLKVTRKGFIDFEVKDFEIHVGQTVNFRILMQSTENPKPPAPAPAIPQVEDAQFGVASLVTRQQIDSLPDNTRRADTFVLLAPAATQDPNSGALVFTGLPYTNAFLTDTLYSVDTHFLQTSSIAPQLPQDSFSEIQTISTVASAEFGNTATGVVNAITRTEPGRVHGTAYEFFNDHDFDSNPRYGPPGFAPSGSQHQAGATAGGSVLSNQLFWTSNFELVDGKAEGINLISNPLIGNVAGTAVQSSTCTATAAQCLAAANFINSQLNAVVPRSLLSLNGFAKVDYHLTENVSVNFEGGALHSHAPNGVEPLTVSDNGGLLGGNADLDQENRFAKASFTAAISGIAVNDLRVGWYRDGISEFPDTKLYPVTGALSINVAGTPIGANPAYPARVVEQHRMASDTVNLTVGSHSIKGGAVYSRSTDWTDEVYNHGGTYNYSSFTSFAEDYSGNIALHKDYQSFTQNFGNPIVNLHTPQITAFLQDNWKVFPRLTLTAGVWFEKDYMQQPSITNGAFYETGSIPGTDKDFSPRIGVAYLLNNRTVVRLGFGSYFQPYVGQILDSLYTGNAIYQANIALNPTETSAGAPVFPKILTPTSTIPNTETTSGSSNIVYAYNIGFRNPYTEKGALAVERDLGHDTTLTASYIYSRGMRLWTESDQNLPVPTLTETYTIDNASGASVGTFSTPVWNTRTNTEYSHVWEIANQGESLYNGLAVQLRKRMSHGISFQASYTWSHSLDDVGGTPIPQIGFVPSTTYVGDYADDRGDSRFDQRHRAVVNWIWQPTLTKSNSLLARNVVNGWQLSGIATLGSGFHETPMVWVNGQQFSGVTMSYTNSLDGSGGWARVPFLPVGSLLTGPEYNLDARLSRTVPITERVKATLMFEAYNGLNHQNNTSVNDVAYTATLGVLKPVPLLGVGNAANGYPYGTNARRAQVALRITF